MPKALVVRQVTTDFETNVLLVQFQKLSSDGDKIGYHRVGIEPGMNIREVMAFIDADPGLADFSEIPEAHIVRVEDHARATWTPESIAPYNEAIKAAINQQQELRLQAQEAHAAAQQAVLQANEAIAALS